jgi:hypothetical protein
MDPVDRLTDFESSLHHAEPNVWSISNKCPGNYIMHFMQYPHFWIHLSLLFLSSLCLYFFTCFNLNLSCCLGAFLFLWSLFSNKAKNQLSGQRHQSGLAGHQLLHPKSFVRGSKIVSPSLTPWHLSFARPAPRWADCLSGANLTPRVDWLRAVTLNLKAQIRSSEPHLLPSCSPFPQCHPLKDGALKPSRMWREPMPLLLTPSYEAFLSSLLCLCFKVRLV